MAHLETSAETDKLMEKISSYLEKPKAQAESLKVHAKHYKTSNINYFRDLVELQMPKSIRHLLLTKRHDKWMPKILPNIKKGQAFIVVGLMHLLDQKENLLDRFKKQGFTIEKVKFTPPPPRFGDSLIKKLLEVKKYLADFFSVKQAI